MRSVAVGPNLGDKRDYTATVYSSTDAIRQLNARAQHLTLGCDPILKTRFFLRFLRSKGYRPRVVIVSKGRDLCGIVYVQERVIFGLPIGVMWADMLRHSWLNNFLVGKDHNEMDILGCALQELLRLPGTVSVRLRIPAHGWEFKAIRKFIADPSLDVQAFEGPTSHAHLPLPRSHEAFVGALGYRTRHNFRYYRRRFDLAGHRYIQQVPTADLRSVVKDLSERCRRRPDPTTLQKWLDIVTCADRPLTAGLQHANGRWLSIATGYYRPTQAVLFFQLNDDIEFHRESLSVVLRSYLIENLIREGFEELLIWGGTAPPLSRYATHPPTLTVHLDKQTFGWRSMRKVAAAISPWLPKYLARQAQRVAPTGFESSSDYLARHPSEVCSDS